jgi:hypothetical protein
LCEIEEKKMKRAFISFATIALVGAISAVAMAQTGGALPGGAGSIPGAPGMPPNGESAAARFDNGYLADHPEVAQQLAHDPSLANNPQFLAAHPELNQYLTNHPKVRADLQNHPERFIHATSGYGAPEAEFDRSYLDRHPEIAQQLAKNPQLATNPQFLAAHPGLNQYLTNHPQVRTDLQEHPDRFIHAADYERNGSGRWGYHPFKKWRNKHGW